MDARRALTVAAGARARRCSSSSRATASEPRLRRASDRSRRPGSESAHFGREEYRWPLRTLGQQCDSRPLCSRSPPSQCPVAALLVVGDVRLLGNRPPGAVCPRHRPLSGALCLRRTERVPRAGGTRLGGARGDLPRNVRHHTRPLGELTPSSRQPLYWRALVLAAARPALSSLRRSEPSAAETTVVAVAATHGLHVPQHAGASSAKRSPNCARR